MPEASSANTHGVSFQALAEVELSADPEGVIFAQGSRFGGDAPFVKDLQLVYVHNFLGISPEQKVVAAALHIVGVAFTKERLGDYRAAHGPLRLYIDDEVVADQRIRTRAANYSLAGEGLCIGYDSGDAVSREYKPKLAFSGGRVVKVGFDVADDAYVDIERHMAAAMVRD